MTLPGCASHSLSQERATNALLKESAAGEDPEQCSNLLASRCDWGELEPRRGMEEQVLAAANNTIELIYSLSIAFVAFGRHMIC